MSGNLDTTLHAAIVDRLFSMAGSDGDLCAQDWGQTDTAAVIASLPAPDTAADSVWTTDANGDVVNLMAHVVRAHGIDLGDSGCSYCAKAAALAALPEPNL